MASRASAWVRCEPHNPNVEIHVNWGLADALQYYAYDTVDVHVPTKNISYYPDYKSHFVMPQNDGSWHHVRVKNEVARSQCISRAEVLDVATRSMEICQGLDEACHIMWFIGCVYKDGSSFNLPWYWTKAHDQSTNPDRVELTASGGVKPSVLGKFVIFDSPARTLVRMIISSGPIWLAKSSINCCRVTLAPSSEISFKGRKNRVGFTPAPVVESCSITTSLSHCFRSSAVLRRHGELGSFSARECDRQRHT